MVAHMAGVHAGMEKGVKPGRSRWAPATRAGRAEAGKISTSTTREATECLRAPSHNILILSEDPSGHSVARIQEGRQWKWGAREDTPAVVKIKNNGGQSRVEMERKGRSEICGLPYDQVVQGTLSPGLRPHPARHSLALHPELPTNLYFRLVKWEWENPPRMRRKWHEIMKCPSGLVKAPHTPFLPLKYGPSATDWRGPNSQLCDATKTEHLTPNPHTLPTVGGLSHTPAPQAPWPDLGTGTCPGLVPVVRVARRSWVSPLPTETQVGGRGGGVGTWTSAPNGAGEKPMEQRWQPLRQISFQIQRSEGDRAVSTLHAHTVHQEREGDWPPLPAGCTRGPSLTTGLLSTATALPWHPGLEMILLTNRDPLSETAMGRTDRILCIFNTRVWETEGRWRPWTVALFKARYTVWMQLVLKYSEQRLTEQQDRGCQWGESVWALLPFVFWPRQTSQETLRSRRPKGCQCTNVMCPLPKRHCPY